MAQPTNTLLNVKKRETEKTFTLSKSNIKKAKTSKITIRRRKAPMSTRAKQTSMKSTRRNIIRKTKSQKKPMKIIREIPPKIPNVTVCPLKTFIATGFSF